MASRNVLAPPSHIPAGAPADGDGIALGSRPVTVEAYIDCLCPFCRMFEEQHGEAVDEMADRGVITAVTTARVSRSALDDALLHTGCRRLGLRVRRRALARIPVCAGRQPALRGVTAERRSVGPAGLQVRPDEGSAALAEMR